MKSFFLPLFAAALLVCCVMVIVISIALVTRTAGEWWKAVLFVVPNAIFLAWATREMFGASRQFGRRPTRSVIP